MRVHSHYENLKVARDAPHAVIRAAYRALTQQYHPDRNPDDAKSQRIMGMLNRAYDVLSDPERRSAHDAWIRDEEANLLRQHDDAVRQRALQQAAARRPKLVAQLIRNRRKVAGATALALVLSAAVIWAPPATQSGSSPSRTTASR